MTVEVLSDPLDTLELAALMRRDWLASLLFEVVVSEDVIVDMEIDLLSATLTIAD
jgi:hypothetical protein